MTKNPTQGTSRTPTLLGLKVGRPAAPSAPPLAGAPAHPQTRRGLPDVTPVSACRVRARRAARMETGERLDAGGPLGARSMAGAGLRRASVGDTTPIVIPLGMMLLSVVFKKCKQSNIIAVKLPKSLLHGGGVLRVRRLACTCGVCPACA